MSGKLIAEQIVLDAKLEAQKIVDKAQLQVDEMRQKYLDFASKQNEILEQNLREAKEEMEDSFASNLKIEKNKVLYRKKQIVLGELKEKTLQTILNFDKKKKLKLVDTLVKYNAEIGDTLFVKITGLNLTDIKSLEIVKKLKLKVQTGFDFGLILSNNNVDKNLLFEDLISLSMQVKESEISKILFD